MPASQYFILNYILANDYLKLRAPHRREHIQLAMQYVERGELLLGGACEDPVDRAVLIFCVSDRSQVEEFVKRDPYIKGKAVVDWSIQKYNAVVGTACKNPIQLSDLK